MTPHTAGMASWTARIRRAGVLWSSIPTSRNDRLMMLSVSAFNGSGAAMK